LHYEYCSEQIWAAVVEAVREAVAKAAAAPENAVQPEQICAIACDATCSLVLLGENDEPISVRAGVEAEAASSPSAGTAAAASPLTSSSVPNVICWMDHRAAAEAAEITAQKHAILSSLGGVVSPEHQIPKLLWLSRHLPSERWGRVRRAMDLTDWLAYRASGGNTGGVDEARSVCTMACKFTFQAHLHDAQQKKQQQQKAAGEAASSSATTAGAASAAVEGGSGWSDSFFESIGLGEFVQEGYRRIGRPELVKPIGSRIGPLSVEVAKAFGLPTSTLVGVGLIDAHAGGVGMLGAALPPVKPDSASASATATASSSTGAESATADDVDERDLSGRMAVICGTSTCHMAVSARAAEVLGVWGPFWSALVPDRWLLEGGESATGALLDHIVTTHPAYAQAKAEAAAAGSDAPLHLHEYLNQVLLRLAQERKLSDVALLTADVHVLPYFHGNRSPRADASLLGVVGGLSLASDVSDLAVKYLATIQALAYGTRHIRDVMAQHGVATSSLFLTGGLSKNTLFVQQHADANACVCYLPRESDGVLLGSAIAAATAAGLYPSLTDAMRHMTHVGRAIHPAPADSAQARFHQRKFKVFLQMHDDQQRWRAIMHEDG
jgi:FGGY-family pentulose kinase